MENIKSSDLLEDKVKNLSNLCPECESEIIIQPERGEMVCEGCGLVVGEHIIDVSHNGKRAFTQLEKEKRENTGSPITSLLPDMGLSTVIDKKNLTNPDLKRAAKWNTRMTWDKRNMLLATTELKRIASNLNLPNHVKQLGIKIYKIAFSKKLLRGRSINGMVSASLYFACRKQKIPRTLQEIIDETNVKPRDVRRCYRTLVRELNLKVPSTNPVILLPRYITELELSQEIEKETVNLLEKFMKNFSISGKDPKGLCAGVIYLVCKVRNIKVSQKKIASVIGVTEVTLRSRYKELSTKLRIGKA